MLAAMRSTVLLATLLTACGGAAETGSTTTAATGTTALAETTTTETAPATPLGATGGFEVHEWALLDVLDGGTTELAGGPGHPPPMTSVRKPVLYVHLPDGTDELAFALDARMTSGSILEHWPASTVTGGSVHWDAVARRAHCDTVVPSTRGRWATPADGVTELPDLPIYDATDAACLTVGTETAGLLFYRGTLGTPTLPLSVTRGADMNVTVTATSDTTGAPGEVLRLSTALSGPWPIGHVVISRAPMPTNGTSVTLPVGTVAVDPAGEGAQLAAAMLTLGMTQPEADAFVRAWQEALFGAGDPASRREARDDRGPTVPELPQDAVIYWLPTAAVDSIATLTITPAPSAVRRAFLVRVTLPGVATAELATPRETYATR